MTISLTLNKDFCIKPPYRTFLDTGLFQCVISKQLGLSSYSSCSSFIPYIFSIAVGRHIIAVVSRWGRRVIVIRFKAWFTRRVGVRRHIRHFYDVWDLVMLFRRNYFLNTTVTPTWGVNTFASGQRGFLVVVIVMFTSDELSLLSNWSFRLGFRLRCEFCSLYFGQFSGTGRQLHNSSTFLCNILTFPEPFNFLTSWSGWSSLVRSTMTYITCSQYDRSCPGPPFLSKLRTST